jgi:endoglucanase
MTTTLATAADATVRDGSYANTNYGTATTIQAKVSGRAGSGYNREAHLRFSLSSLPAGTRNSVKLRLYGKLDNTGQTNLNVGVYAVSNTTWGEKSIKYSNKPAAGSKLGQITIVNTTSKWHEIDLTSYVKSQLSAGKTAVAFALKSLASSGPVPTFVSGEGGSNAPQLVVVTAPTASRNAPIVNAFSKLMIDAIGDDVLNDA